MPNSFAITRRMLFLMTGATVMTACSRNRFEVEPVVIGDSAVLPDMTIMQAIDASAAHTRLAAALRATGLDAPLSGPGPFTLLAPTDAAFAAIRPKSEGGRVTGNPGILKRTLRGHILPAQVSVMDIDAGIDQSGGETKALGLNGLPVAFDREGGSFRAYDTRGRRALLSPMDAVASNGLIHVIDDVLLLPESEESAAEEVSP